MTLYFADIYPGTAETVGARVFDVDIQGSTAFKALDIAAEAGGFAAMNRTKTVKVDDGMLKIDLLPVVENPKLSSIEVHLASEARYVDSTEAPTPRPTNRPTIRPTASPTPRPTPSPTPKPSMAPTPFPTERPTPRPSPAPTSYQFEPIRINSGSSVSFTDSEGLKWNPDEYYINGNVNAVSDTVAIAKTSDDNLFRSERYGPLKYEIPLRNGEYSVTLLFADIYPVTAQSAGKRVFDVSIEGATVFEGLDIVQEAGGYSALRKTKTITVSDGALSVELKTVIELPKISGIEIHLASDARYEDSEPFVAPTNSPTPRPNPSPTPRPTKSPTPQPTAKPSPAPVVPAAPPVKPLKEPIRINAGGPGFVDNRGRVWQADNKYFNTGGKYENAVQIANTGNYDERLYQTERYDEENAPEMYYEVPVPNGNYLVTLHFSEIYKPAHEIGFRVLDVLLEGFGVIKDLDIFSEVGANAALTKSVPTAVSDGALTIEFLSIEQSPKINAIEIEPLGKATAHQAHAVPGGPYYGKTTARWFLLLIMNMPTHNAPFITCLKHLQVPTRTVMALQQSWSMEPFRILMASVQDCSNGNGLQTTRLWDLANRRTSLYQSEVITLFSKSRIPIWMCPEITQL